MKNEKQKKAILKATFKDFLEKIKKNRYYQNFEDIAIIYNQVYNIYIKNENELLYNNSFSNGNKKLKENILIYNLPSIVTCACACPGCYAIKAEYLRCQPRQARGRNFFIMLLCQKDNTFKEHVSNIYMHVIEKHAMLYNMPIVRLHESGDIFHEDYALFWENIVKKIKAKNEKIKFYNYTKTLYKIDGCNTVESLVNIDNKPCINFGDIDYIIEKALILKKNKIDFKICGYGLTNEDINKLSMHGLYNYIAFGKCGECMACCVEKIVFFKKH